MSSCSSFELQIHFWRKPYQTSNIKRSVHRKVNNSNRSGTFLLSTDKNSAFWLCNSSRIISVWWKKTGWYLVMQPVRNLFKPRPIWRKAYLGGSYFNNAPWKYILQPLPVTKPSEPLALLIMIHCCRQCYSIINGPINSIMCIIVQCKFRKPSNHCLLCQTISQMFSSHHYPLCGCLIAYSLCSWVNRAGKQLDNYHQFMQIFLHFQSCSTLVGQSKPFILPIFFLQSHHLFGDGQRKSTEADEHPNASYQSGSRFIDEVWEKVVAANL